MTEDELDTIAARWANTDDAHGEAIAEQAYTDVAKLLTEARRVREAYIEGYTKGYNNGFDAGEKIGYERGVNPRKIEIDWGKNKE